MKVLLVYAHEEPKSFNGAMKDLAVSVLGDAGHDVRVSDLYAMKFKATGDAGDFDQRRDPDFLKYQVEQKHAYENGTLADDIRQEQEKLLWCDLLILQFPLWWFSVPAIMKGWVDRVFTTGFAYGGGKWYDKGGLVGRKAMLSLTTGGPPSMFSSRGLNGDLENILFHINHGMLYFIGFQVIPQFVAYGPAHIDDAGRVEILEQYKQRLLNLESLEPIPYHTLDDYDERFELKVT